MDKRPLKERALRGALWAAAGANGAQILAFILFVMISRVVGPTAFGVVAVSLLLIETLRALTVEAVGVNLVTRGAFDPRAFNAGLAISSTLALVATIGLVLAAPLTAQGFQIDELRSVLPQLAPLLLMHAVARLYEAELSVRMRFRALAVRSVGAVALGGAVGLWAAYAGQGVNALILQQWVAAIAALVLMTVQAEWRPNFSFSREELMRLARESAALAPAGVLTNLRVTIDGLAVATFSGAAAAGAYSLAKRTRLAFQLGFSAAIGRVSLPAFGAVKQDRARLSSATEQSVQLAAVVAFPIFMGVAAIAPELISVFLGPEWSAAAAPMAFLMAGGALAVTTRLFENVLIVCDRRSAVVASNVVSLALLVVLLLAFARLGPGNVAAITAGVGVMQHIVAWVMVRRHVAMSSRSFFMRVWAPMLICFAMIGVVSWLRPLLGDISAPYRLIVLVAAGAVFYTAASWLLNRSAVLAAVQAARAVLPKSMMPT